jgi:hypothetical protein
VVGFVATVLAILAVPVVLVPPESRSAYFWLRIVWAEFLATIVWAYLGGFAGAGLSADKGERGQGGMLRAIGVTAVTFAVISGALLIGDACLPDSSPLNRVHLAIQIVLAAGALVVCVFVYFTRVAADSGAE